MRFASLTLLLAVVTAIQAQDDAGKQLYQFLQSKAKEHFDARRKVVAETKTREAIEARQKELKAKFLEALGGFPSKNPLNAQITGEIKGDGFTVQKVVYESRPNHHVSANFYLPPGKGPFPGVLVPCGHSTDGKVSYQAVCALLARNGMAALCYDPIGQGERFQFLNEKGEPPTKSSTGEHTQVGIGALLVGTSTATYRIWDGIRSIDYLVSRPEVDAKRIGCTGNSGGGTLTSYLMALDDRIYAAAPSCYICSLEKLFETRGPQDAEQNILGQVAFGMEHADYLTMRAPKPTLMCVATYDFFDIDGAWDVYREAHVVFGRLGYADRVAIAEFEDKHGFTKPRREAATRWMARWLLNKDDAIFEDKLEPFKEAQLKCTRTGQVLTDLKGISAFAINEQIALRWAKNRLLFTERPEAERNREIRRLLALDEKVAAAQVGENRYTPEPGLTLTLTRGDKQASTGNDILLFEAGDTKATRPPIRADLRGLDGKPGASEYKNAFMGVHLNRPLAGQRTRDILALIESQFKDKKVTLHASGLACIPALHAAVLHPNIEHLVLDGMVVSWGDVVRTPMSKGQLSNVVPGAMKAYDLPELAVCLAPRALTLRNVVDASGARVSRDDVQKAYMPARLRYESAGAAGKFVVE